MVEPAPPGSVQTAPAAALWRLLQGAAGCVLAVRRGRSGTAALEQVDAALRPGVQALVFQVWRSLARAENLRRQLASRAPPAGVDALMCVVLALGWREQDAPYEIFTLVNQAVEAAKRDPSTRAQAGFVNACLRRFLRERDAMVAQSQRDPVAAWNHPRWWIERVQREHPGRWQEILQADLRQAPMTLRVNLRRTTRPDYMALLAHSGIDADAVGAAGVCLRRALPVQRVPGFDAGLVSVQDAAAQMAAPLLLGPSPVAPGLNVLDACAAPGGKTAHLLEWADCHVTALDIDPQRCERIGQTLARLGLHADVLAADAARPQDWWRGQAFDAILLDAPCTASGIVRRHPDVPWLRREADIARLADVQAALLRTLWPLLRPGGRLLYCTCSVFRDEGDNQIQTFVEHNTDALLLPSVGHLLPGLPANGAAVPDNPDGEHDGFFYALLESVRPDGFAALLVALVLFSGAAWPLDSESGRSQVTQLRLERSADGIVLFASVQLELSAAVEDALAKGIPMVFLAEADIVRQRWFWTDKKVVSAQRHMRLAFQPLTRRWRLNVASGPIQGNSLGLALNLNFDTLQEAMSTMLRISGWRIADADVVDAIGTHRLEFRFGLDMAQLPRPFQIGAFGQSDWNISASASQQIGPESTK